MKLAASAISMVGPAPIGVGRERLLKSYVLAFAVAMVASVWVSHGAGETILILTMALAFWRAPVEISTIVLCYSTFLISIFGGLDPNYYNKWRWLIIFGGSAVVYYRFSVLPSWNSIGYSTLFVQAMSVYALSAIVSTGYSTAAMVTFFKASILVIIIGVSAATTRRIVAEYGTQSASRYVQCWLWILAPAWLFHHYALVQGATPALDSAYQLGLFRGGAGNANSLGVAISIILPLFLCHFLEKRIKWTRLQQTLFVGVVTIIYMLLLTHSRASTLAFAVALVILLKLHPRSMLSRMALGLLGVALLASIVQPFRMYESVNAFIYKGEESRGLLGSRIHQWESARDVFLKYPWLGTGFGVTSSQQEEWSIENNRYIQFETGSSFWALLSQLGIFVGVLVYAAIVKVLIRAYLFARRAQDPFLSGLVASCWAAFINSFFEGWLVSPGNGVFWYFLLGCFLLDAIMTKFRAPLTRTVWRDILAPAGRAQAVAPLVRTPAAAN